MLTCSCFLSLLPFHLLPNTIMSASTRPLARIVSPRRGTVLLSGSRRSWSRALCSVSEPGASASRRASQSGDQVRPYSTTRCEQAWYARGSSSAGQVAEDRDSAASLASTTSSALVDDSDVVIVGGGVVGLALACGLGKSSMNIALRSGNRDGLRRPLPY